MRSPFRAVVALMTTGLVFACSAPTGSAADDASEDPVATAASAIVKGATDTAEHDPVVLLVLEPKGKILGSCTGTLVAPNLVLTARHCVSDTDETVICKADGSSYQGGAIKSDYGPSALYVYTGVNAIYYASAPSKAAARGKTIITETSSVLCNHDVAFVVLDTDVDLPTAPIRTASTAVKGESLTAVGWGLTSGGKLPSTRQVRSGVPVTVVGPAIADEETNIGIGDSEFAIGEAICSGDSGGPAFSTKGAVVGVVSRGGGGGTSDTNAAASCIGTDVVNEYTELSKKGDLVAKAFSVAGYSVRTEGTAMGVPLNQACTSDEACSSQACVAGTCVVRCDDSVAAACGLGQTCTAKGSVKVCLTPSQVTALTNPASSTSAGGSDDGGCASSPAPSRSTAGGLLVALATVALARRRAGRSRAADR